MAERIQQLLSGIVLMMILLIFAFLFWFALPVFFTPDSTTFSLLWQPEHGHYGILPMLAASSMLGVMSLVVALPVAVGIAGFCQLNRYRTIATWIRRLIRLMSGVPTVVYGIAAVFLLVPFLRNSAQCGSGFSLLAATLMIVLLILPVMVMVLDSFCQPLAKQLNLTAASMGLSDTQVVFHVIIPAAKKVIGSAALLGFSRAIGDTLLPLMLAGNAPQVAENVFDSIRTLTAHIGLVIATENASEYNSLFAAGFLLLCINVFITLLIRRVEHAYQHGSSLR